MPVPLESAKMVSKEFSGVLMGGYDGSFPTSVMRELTCEFGTCFWRKMSQKLEEPRRDFVAMIIPDSLANCTNESWFHLEEFSLSYFFYHNDDLIQKL